MQFRGGKYDVIVIGTGPTGAKAALAAARTGCSTLLLTLNSGTVASVMCSSPTEESTQGHSLREVDVVYEATDENMHKLTIETQIDNPYSAVYILQAQTSNQKLLSYNHNTLPHFEGDQSSSEPSEERSPIDRDQHDEPYQTQTIDSRSVRDPFQTHNMTGKQADQNLLSEPKPIQASSTNPVNIRPFKTKATAKVRKESSQASTPAPTKKVIPVERTNPERAPFQSRTQEKPKMGPFQTKLPSTKKKTEPFQTQTVERRLEPFQSRAQNEKNESPFLPFSDSKTKLRGMEEKRRTHLAQTKKKETDTNQELDQSSLSGFRITESHHSILQEREANIRGKLIRRDPPSLPRKEQPPREEKKESALNLSPEINSVFREREVKQRRRLIGGARKTDDQALNFTLMDRQSDEKKEKELQMVSPPKAEIPSQDSIVKESIIDESLASTPVKRRPVDPPPAERTQKNLLPKKRKKRHSLVWEEGQTPKRRPTTKKPAPIKREQESIIPLQEAARQILKQTENDGLKQDHIDFEDPYGSNSWEELHSPFENEESDLQLEKRKLALRGLNSLINNLG